MVMCFHFVQCVTVNCKVLYLLATALVVSYIVLNTSKSVNVLTA